MSFRKYLAFIYLIGENVSNLKNHKNLYGFYESPQNSNRKKLLSRQIIENILYNKSRIVSPLLSNTLKK